MAFLRNLEHSVGLYVYDANLADEMAVAMISRKMGLDFDDALQYYVAKKLGVDAIASFDEHFDKLDIRRVEPRDLLPATKKVSGLKCSGSILAAMATNPQRNNRHVIAHVRNPRQGAHDGTESTQPHQALFT